MAGEGKKKNGVTVALVLAAVALVANCILLEARNVSQSKECETLQETCRRLADSQMAVANKLQSLEGRVALLENPPPEPSIGDRARVAYRNVKGAVTNEVSRIRSAASAGYEAARREYGK